MTTFFEEYKIPVRLQSEANISDHWTRKKKRKDKIKLFIKSALRKTKIQPPCEVTLIRVAPRMLDVEDNLPMCLKTAKDCVADILVPGLQYGRADGNKSIVWHLNQEKGGVREYALIIKLKKEQ